MKVYLTARTNNYNAQGEFNPETKETIVYKGSIVTADISQSKTFRGAKSVARTREQYVKNQKVTEDVKFKSPSTAANFVTGRSSDGFSTWKMEDGRTLKQLRDED